jgi:multiple sugar transport system permease protein
MAILHDAVQAAPHGEQQLRTSSGKTSLRWVRFAIVAVITAIAIIPVVVVVYLALRPGVNSTSHAAITFENLSNIFNNTDTLKWLRNSLFVTLSTVLVSVVVAAPAGYVLSRGRGRTVSGYSLLLFIVQSLPVITAVIPLFILFAKLGLVDSLNGLIIIYVGASMSVAVWMMAAYMDSIPRSLEEAAWIDGASVFGSFTRIVLRNSLPGVLSTAIFTYLVSWNDYLVAIVFMRTSTKFTLPLGVESFFQQNVTDWGSVMAVAVVMMAPPVIVFACLNRYFSVGGIGGSLAGQ